MIEQHSKELSVKHQCEILGISRSSAYYESSDVVCNNDLEILEKIRKVLNNLPFYGYRKVSREVSRLYFAVTEKQIRRIMARAGLKAIYPGRNLSKSRQEHKKYPYLLDGKIIRYPNQVWATYIIRRNPAMQSGNILPPNPV
jgi:putative transposase